MNKTLLTIFITALIVGGGVYFWQQNRLTQDVATETTETAPVTEEPEELSIKAVIEDFDSYVEIDDSEIGSFPPGGCLVYKRYLDRVAAGEIDASPSYEERMKDVDWEKYVEFDKKLETGEIKRKEIFRGRLGTSLSLILTPRYDFEENDRDEMDKCIEGVGYLSLFKVFDDYILWGQTHCTGGFVHTEEEEPGITKEIEECEKVREELIKYEEA